MSITDRLLKLNSELPSNVKLVAVSKYQPIEKLIEAYNSGQRVFAESRPQEFLSKVSQLPNDVEWHFIGHLQTNKLKMVLPNVSLLHSVDSLRLLESIQKWAVANNKVISVLLELHIATEDTKQGFTSNEILSIISQRNQYPNIVFKGLMAMASFTDDQALIRTEFNTIQNLYNRIKSENSDIENFKELSIGMSSDYQLAISSGSTMVRIGSYIFND